MKCPHCQHSLTKATYLNLEVDQCTHCKGIWLDPQELDSLEDTKLDADELKGTLKLTDKETQLLCPHCQEKLKRFEYRFEDFDLDFCPQEHGWWLDAGEAEKIVNAMEARAKGLQRKFKVEEEWAQKLTILREPSIIKKLKLFFLD
jgi:Zn-finger nucleic acid-binding protein